MKKEKPLTQPKLNISGEEKFSTLSRVRVKSLENSGPKAVHFSFLILKQFGITLSFSNILSWATKVPKPHDSASTFSPLRKCDLSLQGLSQYLKEISFASI